MSILKILAGQPDGRASMDVVKQYLAVLYTSGPEWVARTKRLAERAPELDIFSQKLVAREPGEWRITDEGKAFLGALERPTAGQAELTLEEMIEHPQSRIFCLFPIHPSGGSINAGAASAGTAPTARTRGCQHRLSWESDDAMLWQTGLAMCAGLAVKQTASDLEFSCC